MIYMIQEIIIKSFYNVLNILIPIYLGGLIIVNLIILFYMWAVKNPRRFDLYPMMFIISTLYPFMLYSFFYAAYNIIKKVRSIEKNASK